MFALSRIYNRVISFGVSPHRKRCFSFSAIDMASKDGELRVFIVAGEVSGDAIGSRLMAFLKKLSPLPMRFQGVGGLMMSKQGLKSLFPIDDIAVMGIWELLPHLHKFRVLLKQTIKAAEVFEPHVVVTVDSKGFPFHLLKQLRARYAQQGLVSPLQFHYVAPSFWAWKGAETRLKGLAEFVDHVFCILPFEVEVCKLNGLAATFVGHPTVEDVLELKSENGIAKEWKLQGNAEEFRRKYGISSVHVAPNHHVEEYICKVVDEWPVPVVLVPGGSSLVKYDAFAVRDLIDSEAHREKQVAAEKVIQLSCPPKPSAGDSRP